MMIKYLVREAEGAELTIGPWTDDQDDIMALIDPLLTDGSDSLSFSPNPV